MTRVGLEGFEGFARLAGGARDDDGSGGRRIDRGNGRSSKGAGSVILDEPEPVGTKKVEPPPPPLGRGA